MVYLRTDLVSDGQRHDRLMLKLQIIIKKILGRLKCSLSHHIEHWVTLDRHLMD